MSSESYITIGARRAEREREVRMEARLAEADRLGYTGLSFEELNALRRKYWNDEGMISIAEAVQIARNLRQYNE